jgi:hypothetical protein
MNNLTFRHGVVCIVVLLPIYSAVADEQTLAYLRSTGDSGHFVATISRGAEDIEPGSKHAGTINSTFQCSWKVGSVDADTKVADVSLKLERMAFDYGNPEAGFDSNDPDKMAKAAKDPSSLDAAVLSTTAGVYCSPQGEIGNLRVNAGDRDLDESLTEPLKKMWTEISGYLAVRLSKDPVDIGSTWTGQIPVTMVGGMLSGSQMYVDALYKLDKIEPDSNNQKHAFISVTLAKQPSLQLTADSIKDAKFSFTVDNFDGQLEINPDSGYIVRYDLKLRTHFSAASGDQPIDDNTQEFELVVRSLP